MTQTSFRKIFRVSLASMFLFFLSLSAHGGEPDLANQIQRLLNPNLSTVQRIAAAKALGNSENPLALDALVGVLDKSGESLRDTVIEILQKGRGVDILAKRALEESLGAEQRVLAVRGLRVMRNPA